MQNYMLMEQFDLFLPANIFYTLGNFCVYWNTFSAYYYMYKKILDTFWLLILKVQQFNDEQTYQQANLAVQSSRSDEHHPPSVWEKTARFSYESIWIVRVS